MKIIDLDNCKNIRDISYGNIKKNKLIRSSSLEKLSNNDILKLSDEYKVKAIIDLRTTTELDEKDKDIPNSTYYIIPLVNEETLGITHGNSVEEKLTNLSNNIPDMCELYRQLVTRDKKEQWTKIFKIFLTNYDGAILWHCKQGKDRCGIVSAIIEYCLGIDYKVIMEDYLLTNNYCIEKSNKMFDLMYEITKDYEKSNVVKNLFLAKKEYLDSAFEYIGLEYGSVYNFLYEVCNLDKEKIEKLKQMYLK